MKTQLLVFCVYFTLFPQINASADNSTSLIFLKTNNLQESKFDILSNQNNFFQPNKTVEFTKTKIKKKHKSKQKLGLDIQQIETISKNPINKTRIKRKRRKRRRKKKLTNETKHHLDSLKEITTTPQSTELTIKMNKILTDVYNLSSTINSKKRNRCSVKNGGCSQICKSKGKQKCACLKGYRLTKNRKKCIDINECKVRNGGCKDICRNTLGAYFCDCNSGFRLSEDLKSCQDINECHLRNGHGPCQDTCRNTHGSYICDCSNLNGTKLANDKHSCDYIDHCWELNPGCSHLCINTRYGGFCSCPDGMELMSDFKTCQDLDECENPFIKSQCLQNCINTIGSYYCEEDIQNDHYINKTKIPSCPPLDLPKIGFITCLRNNTLPYDTYTKNGRKIIRNSPGTKCNLECPVGYKLLGEGRYICDVSGIWILKQKGLCIKSPNPKLQCPNNLHYHLRKNRKRILVDFPAPQTNVHWKFVKSHPKWAKNLKGILLEEGHHEILFYVTDPASKLSSTCSFSIIVKK